MSMTKKMVLEKMKDKDAVVLNVLSPEAYEKMHIRGSFNVSLANNPVAFVKRVEMLYGKHRFFITHCTNVGCGAGPSAAKALQESGFEAEDYPGGIEEWYAAGLPVDGTEVPHHAMN